MHELSKENMQLIAGGYQVFVTPEWKHNEAVISGTILAVLGVAVGALGLFSEISSETLAIPFVFGAAGYGLGYSMSRLENSHRQDYKWYDIQAPMVTFI